MFWKRRIYADAAASTPLSPAARAELVRLLDLYGNPGGLHHESVEAKKELEAARKKVAEAIGAHADEIVFTGGGTEANNLACRGIKFSLALTTEIEHASVLEPLREKATLLSVNEEGLLDPKELAEKITDEVGFVSIQMVNSEIGVIQPIREIAKVLRTQNRKIFFHTDAAQAPLWLPLRVEHVGVDMMTLDAQKIMGPKGVGCLYVKRGTPLHAIQLGGGQERGLRAGTENVALVGAFAAALVEAQAKVEETAPRVAEVRDYLLAEIRKRIPDVHVNGTLEHRVANNLNISIPHLNAEMAVIAMDREGVALSTRSACDTDNEEPSHVIQALGVDNGLAGSALRVSFLPTATTKDAHTIAQKLEEVMKRYSKK